MPPLSRKAPKDRLLVREIANDSRLAVLLEHLPESVVEVLRGALIVAVGAGEHEAGDPRCQRQRLARTGAGDDEQRPVARRAGGMTMAQDEATSTVFGMR